jgi:hypothetical protein
MRRSARSLARLLACPLPDSRRPQNLSLSFAATVAYLKHPNRFVGMRSRWQPDCVDSIGSAQARPDRGLNGFIRGHFPDQEEAFFMPGLSVSS